DNIAQLVRMNCTQKACTGIERALAQSREPHAETLLAAQRLLEKDAGEQFLLHCMRGERIFADQAFQKVENGEWTIDGLSNGGEPVSVQDRVKLWLIAGSVKENRARTLRLLSEDVEISKQPVDQQVNRFAAFRASIAELKDTRFSLAQMFGHFVPKSVDASHKIHAQLRCGIAALAAERFRLANGRWPESLDKLVPKYLSA